MSVFQHLTTHKQYDRIDRQLRGLMQPKYLTYCVVITHASLQQSHRSEIQPLLKFFEFASTQKKHHGFKAHFTM